MNFWKYLWSMLTSECGQVPAEGEIGPEGAAPPEGETPPEGEAPPEGGEGEPAGPEQGRPPVQDFLSESKKRGEVMALINGNPTLKQAYGWMQSAYQKTNSGRKQLEEKASIVDRFESDANFATQTVQQWAARNGYSLSRGQAQQIAAQATGAPATSGANGVPPQYVEAVKAGLPTELQWMADSIATATFAANQAMLRPLQESAEKQSKVERERQYDETASKLSEDVPGWEEHEDDMNELLGFLHSGAMTHKKFGSKLRLLYDVVTKNAVVMQEATKRLNGAARNRTTSGQVGRTTNNVQDRIRKAKNMDEAFDIATKAAEEELQRNGQRVLT